MNPTAEQEWLSAAVGGRVREFYAEIGVELRGAGREAMVSCFANPGSHKRDDRDPSCQVNLLTGLWCCHGCGAKGNAYQAALARGCSERDAAEMAKRAGLFIEREHPETFTMGGWRQYLRWIAALQARPKIIARLGELKGWTPYAIRRCGLGWDGERLTFIISRPVGAKYQPRIVGVMRYLPGGTPKVKAMPGSERNLFPRPELVPRDAPLFVVEGEPDAVSVRSAGHYATAIPGTGSWKTEWAQRLTRFERVIVLCDCDPQGRELAAKVKTVLPRARVVDLDLSRDDGYDIGDVVAEAACEGGVWQATRLLDSLSA